MSDLTAIEKRVLRAWDNCSEEFGVLNFNDIAERSALTRAIVEPVVRHLASKGLTRFERGTFTEEGRPYGSGYSITDAGRSSDLSPSPQSRVEGT